MDDLAKAVASARAQFLQEAASGKGQRAGGARHTALATDDTPQQRGGGHVGQELLGDSVVDRCGNEDLSGFALAALGARGLPIEELRAAVSANPDTIQ